MNKAVLLFSIAVLSSASNYDDIIESMHAFKNEETKNIELNHNQNTELIKKNAQYYSKISDEATAYYQDFLSKKWGEKNVKLSNISTFTQYNENMDARQSADFENGIVTIEVVLDEEQKITPQYFDEILKNFSKQSLSEAIKKDPINSLESKFMESKLIVTSYQKQDDSKLLDGYIEYKKTTPDDIKYKKVILKNGESKFIYYVDIKMVPDHLKKRALKFKPYVLTKAREYGVKPSTIFAIIQTESYFNPLAKSHIPAYGLMQIVPTTAGVDSYYALTKNKKLLSPKYLYNANNNIEIGSKYVQIIQDQYLKGITNPISKSYCISTSYNAGIGSLIYSFTGSKRKRAEAIDIINSMTPDEVYTHLSTSSRLTDEAKHYVKNIKLRSENYKIWDTEV